MPSVVRSQPRRMLCALAACLAWIAPALPAGAAGQAPYPPSTAVPGVSLDWSTYRRLAPGSDNWPTTWAANGAIYTSWGDGGGFGPDAVKKAYVSFGLASLTGNSAATLSGTNLLGGLSPALAPCFPSLGGMVDHRHSSHKTMPCARKGLAGKSRSLLAYGGSLYSFITPGSTTDAYKEARLYTAPLGSAAWTRASWAFTRRSSPPLLQPNFVQAGPDGAALGYIYAYAARYAPAGFALQKGVGGGQIYLLRANKGANLLDRASWQFYAGLSGVTPLWTPNQVQAQPVFADRNGVSFEISAIYAPALGRYLLMTEHGRSHSGQIGMFEAPTPQGPWSTVFYGTFANGAVGVPATTFYANLLADSLAGNRFTLLFTGTNAIDALNAVDGQFR